MARTSSLRLLVAVAALSAPLAAAPAYAQKYGAGSIGVCVNSVLLRTDRTFTIATISSVDANGAFVAMFFDSKGGFIDVNSQQSIIPQTRFGWKQGQTSDLLYLLSQAATAKRPVTIEYDASSSSVQPITGVQAQTTGGSCP